MGSNTFMSKFYMRIFINLIFILFYSFSCIARETQKVVIDSISFEELYDITASVEPEFDENSNPCALIKIYAPLIKDMSFPTESFIKLQKVDNSIWLWVKDGCTGVTIKAKDLEPHEILFSNFGYPKLHGKTTYQLNITVGHETEKIVYKDIYHEKKEYKTKFTDSFEFDKDKIYNFLTYQFQCGLPLGINYGLCQAAGFFISFNYYRSDFELIKQGGSPYEMFTYIGGLMFRLKPSWYLQAGAGLSREPDSNLFFTGGMTLLFRYKRLILGGGYYYNKMYEYYDRNILLNGLTFQVGLTF